MLHRTSEFALPKSVACVIIPDEQWVTLESDDYMTVAAQVEPLAVAEIPAIDEAERLRANIYALLARCLARAPDADELAELSELSGDDTPLGQAITALAEASKSAETDALSEEYETLFIGVGRGELLPYGSYYLTGFLHEKPLARLRGALRVLGIERDPAVREPEDHIAALMDVMNGMILGLLGEPKSLADQRAFFREHIQSWAPYFFKDLENAKNATFYRHVGTIGREFIEVEQAAFQMA